MTAVFFEARDIGKVGDCFLSNVMEVPGHGEVDGLADMRAALAPLFSDIDFRGKTVIEPGPASGFFSFEMLRGASVIFVELGRDSDWDYVPHAGVPREDRKRRFHDHLEKLRDGYWFAHKRFGSGARVAQGSAYDLPALGLSGEIGLMCNMLVHLTDPFGALTSLAGAVSDTLIVCDVEPGSESCRMWPMRRVSRHLPLTQFLPKPDNRENDHTWWHLSARSVEHYVRILGFTDTHLVYFPSRPRPSGRLINQWGIVARRPSASPVG